MKKFGNILWGLVFIALGIIIGGKILGYIDANIFFDGWWTLFIIVPCFIGLFKDDSKLGNIIGLLLGVALLLACQKIIDFSMIWKLALPTVFVLVGLSIMFKDTVGGKINKEIKKLNENMPKGENEYCAVFSGQDVKFEAEEFKGAKLTAVFGGVKCDLRNAIINQDVVINTESIFGGISILVPSNVKVKIKSSSVFGGVSNKSNNMPSENSPTIYINGSGIFGGVEIK